MPAAALLDDLLARLPGTVRRGHAPPARAGEAECLPTGIAALDRVLGGGFPRGRLSELRARGSAGTTSLLHRLAARVTTEGSLVAWVDAPGTFDPESAAASGTALDRILWMRPRDVLAAFAATEQILVLGGFALVVLDVDGLEDASERRTVVSRGDMSDAGRSSRHDGRTPSRSRFATERATLWMRLARAAARSQSALVAFGRGPGGAGSSAAVRLELPPAQVLWDRSGNAPALLDGFLARVAVKRNRGTFGEQTVAVSLG